MRREGGVVVKQILSKLMITFHLCVGKQLDNTSVLHSE